MCSELPICFLAPYSKIWAQITRNLRKASNVKERTEQTEMKANGEKKNIMQGEENFKKLSIILLEKGDNILLGMGCYFLKKEHSRKQ